MHFVFLAAGLVLFAQVGLVSARESTVVATSKAANMDQCVEPTNVMRRDHMEFLLHQRDQTVHEGIRTPEHSLIGCIDCHAGKDDDGKFISVNAEQQFCRTCHQSTAVKIDCFECHATVPDTDVSNAKGDVGRLSVESIAQSHDDMSPLQIYLKSFSLN